MESTPAHDDRRPHPREDRSASEGSGRDPDPAGPDGGGSVEGGGSVDGGGSGEGGGASESGRPWLWAVGGIAVILVVAILGFTVFGDDPEEATTAAGSTTTVSAPETTVDPASVALAAWVGEYSWTETAVDGDRSTQLVHLLSITGLDESGTVLDGRLVESGTDIDSDVRVILTPTTDGLATTVASVDRGRRYGGGEHLFNLGGAPGAPVTGLVDLPTLIPALTGTSGAYFLPGDGGNTSGEAAATSTTTMATTAPETTTTPVPAIGIELAGDGLTVIDGGVASSLPFGVDEASVSIVLDRVFGPGQLTESSPECPNDSDRAITWGDQILAEFAGDEFISWSLSPGSPLTTGDGIGLGSSRADLMAAGPVEIFQSSLGVEFALGSGDAVVRGVLDGTDQTSTVIDLWAGDRCLFS
ncbi:MAG: hypothetical protein ACK5PP_17215 [Acidimicrobiales bacterium]